MTLRNSVAGAGNSSGGRRCTRREQGRPAGARHRLRGGGEAEGI